MQQLSLDTFRATSAALAAAAASPAAAKPAAKLTNALDETPARFQRKPLTAAEMAAVESGGAF